MPTDRTLLVSIHDVTPAFAGPIAALYDRLVPLLGGPRLAMLVVPDHWNRAPLAGDPGFLRRLRGWADAGVEMFLHGWSHLDDRAHHRPFDRWRAHHMTAGEGEFLGLGEADALARLRAGRAVVEEATGRPIAGFVAPAWLYGPGARAALRQADIALAEDHLRVWQPATGRVLARGPVVTWASRSRARTASSLAVAAIARAAPDWLATMRVAVHPGDVAKPSLLASIDATIASLARRRTIIRYADLAAGARRS